MTTAPLRGYRDSEIREILDALLCRQGDGNSEFGWEPFKDAAMLGASYPAKKALKAAVGQTLQFIETSMFEPEYDANGTFCVVGPSPFERKWYAKVTMKNGLIFKVE